MSRLVDFAERIASLGPLQASVRPAAHIPGGPGRSAQLRIATAIERPANIGGGSVVWSGYFDIGGNSDWTDDLNALLTALAECIEDVGFVAATVRNAYEARKAAENRSETRRRKLAEVLGADRARQGEFLVRRVLGGDGRVWLLDPVKQEAGFGFEFRSMQALWETHPSLRPIRWEDGDLIVAPIALYQEVTPRSPRVVEKVRATVRHWRDQQAEACLCGSCDVLIDADDETECPAIGAIGDVLDDLETDLEGK